jgi:hypothetical protein
MADFLFNITRNMDIGNIICICLHWTNTAGLLSRISCELRHCRSPVWIIISVYCCVYPPLLINIKFLRRIIPPSSSLTTCKGMLRTYYELLDWLYNFTSRSRIFHLYGDVTITGEGLQNLGRCSVLRAFSAGRDPYRATFAVTRGIGFSDLM